MLHVYGTLHLHVHCTVACTMYTHMMYVYCTLTSTLYTCIYIVQLLYIVHFHVQYIVHGSAVHCTFPCAVPCTFECTVHCTRNVYCTLACTKLYIIIIFTCTLYTCYTLYTCMYSFVHTQVLYTLACAWWHLHVCHTVVIQLHKQCTVVSCTYLNVHCSLACTVCPFIRVLQQFPFAFSNSI